MKSSLDSGFHRNYHFLWDLQLCFSFILFLPPKRGTPISLLFSLGPDFLGHGQSFMVFIHQKAQVLITDQAENPASEAAPFPFLSLQIVPKITIRRAAHYSLGACEFDLGIKSDDQRRIPPAG